MDEMNEDKCANCGKVCDLEESIYKIKHKGKIYCFHSEECKNKFQMEKFGEIVH